MARKNSLPFLSIGAAVVLLVSIVVPSHGHLPFSVCGFHWLTDLPCPLCGLTRAFSAIGHGEMKAAWGFHPLSFVLYALTLFTLAFPTIARLSPQSSERVLVSRRFFSLLTAIMGGVVLYGVLRIALQS